MDYGCDCVVGVQRSVRSIPRCRFRRSHCGPAERHVRHTDCWLECTSGVCCYWSRPFGHVLDSRLPGRYSWCTCPSSCALLCFLRTFVITIVDLGGAPQATGQRCDSRRCRHQGYQAGRVHERAGATTGLPARRRARRSRAGRGTSFHCCSPWFDCVRLLQAEANTRWIPERRADNYKSLSSSKPQAVQAPSSADRVELSKQINRAFAAVRLFPARRE